MRPEHRASAIRALALAEVIDHALRMGSLLVFALLAGAMVATRRVDWSALSARLATHPVSDTDGV